MNFGTKNQMRLVLAAVACLPLLSSCIGDELPDIEADVTGVLYVKGEGVVKPTIQENGVTVYVEPSADKSRLNLDYQLSKNATYQFVDVTITSTTMMVPYQGVMVPYVVSDTVVGPYTGSVTDYTRTRYIKVVAESGNIHAKDQATRNSFSKFGGMDENGKIFRIWSVQVLPAGVPETLGFDKWTSPQGVSYRMPYENLAGSTENAYLWASSNSPQSILLNMMGRDNTDQSQYGVSETPDCKAGGSAIQLQTLDIRGIDPTKPFISGCCFLGEFISTEGSDLKKTHVGLPFNKKPKTLKFWYKYQPGEVSPGVSDRGLVRAVLYRADDAVPYLTGENIMDNNHPNVVAYATFEPSTLVTTYEPHNMTFTYTPQGQFNDEDMKGWKYNLAIYLASSRDGFSYVGSGSTKMWIDEMEVECE